MPTELTHDQTAATVAVADMLADACQQVTGPAGTIALCRDVAALVTNHLPDPTRHGGLGEALTAAHTQLDTQHDTLTGQPDTHDLWLVTLAAINLAHIVLDALAGRPDADGDPWDKRLAAARGPLWQIVEPTDQPS